MTAISDVFSLGLHLHGGDLDETDDPEAPPAMVETRPYACGICGHQRDEAHVVDDVTVACAACRQPLEPTDFL